MKVGRLVMPDGCPGIAMFPGDERQQPQNLITLATDEPVVGLFNRMGGAECVLQGKLDCDITQVTFGSNLETRWLAPVDRPGKIIGVGHNYWDLVSDLGIERPEEPKLFAKWPSTIVGPGDDLVLPSEFSEVSYEAELAVIMGRTARRVLASEALSYVFGYTIVDDITAIDAIRRDIQFTRGKNFDTFLPMGPWIAERSHVPNPNDLAIELRVNGIVRQQSSTSNMIFDVSKLISFISNICTIEPGDIILTGSPTGVARQHEPPAYLVPGDRVEISIDRVGVLSHGVVAL